MFRYQCACLENPKDKGAWPAIVHGVAKGQTQLSVCTCVYAHIRTHTHTHNGKLPLKWLPAPSENFLPKASLSAAPSVQIHLLSPLFPSPRISCLGSQDVSFCFLLWTTQERVNFLSSASPPGTWVDSWLATAMHFLILGFPGGSDDKESACKAGDPGSIPGSGKSPGEGNGNSLRYPCLEKSHGQRSLVGCKSMESQRVWHGWMTNTFSSCASLGTIFLSLHAWPIINVPQECVRAQGWRAVSSLRTKGGTEVGSSWCCKLPSSQSICGCYLVLCLAAWVYLRASFHCSCLSEQRGKPWLT